MTLICHQPLSLKCTVRKSQKVDLYTLAYSKTRYKNASVDHIASYTTEERLFAARAGRNSSIGIKATYQMITGHK